MAIIILQFHLTKNKQAGILKIQNLVKRMRKISVSCIISYYNPLCLLQHKDHFLFKDPNIMLKTWCTEMKTCRKENKNIHIGQRINQQIKGSEITMRHQSRWQAYDQQFPNLEADQFPCEMLPKVAVLFPASSAPTNLAQLE